MLGDCCMSTFLFRLVGVILALFGAEGLVAEVSVPGYHRGYFFVWSDVDQDCQDTRQEVLIEQSVDDVILTLNRCRVVSGRWNDPYTGRVFTVPSDVDVDHVVPLAWAWEHGASIWTPEVRAMFGNDPRNLIVTDDGANQSKGSRGPLQWLPPSEGYHCQYIVKFLIVLNIYSLQLSSEESEDMNTLQETLCGWSLRSIL